MTRAEPTALAVVRTVAAETGRDVTAMPPLYESVDPDALEALVAAAGDRSRAVTVTFRYAGCLVSITAARRLEIEVGGRRPDEGGGDGRAATE